MKKIAYVLLAFAMVLSMSMTALAVEADELISATSEVNQEEGTLTVTVNALQETTNGRVTVTYNSEHLTYVSATLPEGVTGENAGSGTVTVGYTVLGDAIPAGEDIITLSFTINDTVSPTTTLTLTLEDFNEHENIDVKYPDLEVTIGDADLNGLVMDENGVWYYYIDGVLQEDFTGLVYFNETFFYVQNGILDTSYVGLVEFMGAWYYVEGGIINFGFTGLTYFADTFFYVQNGVLDTSYVGLVEFYGAWYYVEGGIINFAFSGLTYFNDTFFYIQNGVLDTRFVGLVYFYGTYYYVEGGIINFNYTGPAVGPDGNTYNVVNGVVQP